MAESDWIRGLIDINDRYSSRMTRPRHLDTNLYMRERQRGTPTAKSRRESAATLTTAAFEEKETPRSRRRSNNNSSTVEQQQQQQSNSRDSSNREYKDSRER